MGNTSFLSTHNTILWQGTRVHKHELNSVKIFKSFPPAKVSPRGWVGVCAEKAIEKSLTFSLFFSLLLDHGLSARLSRHHFENSITSLCDVLCNAIWIEYKDLDTLFTLSPTQLPIKLNSLYNSIIRERQVEDNVAFASSKKVNSSNERQQFLWALNSSFCGWMEFYGCGAQPEQSGLLWISSRMLMATTSLYGTAETPPLRPSVNSLIERRREWGRSY